MPAADHDAGQGDDDGRPPGHDVVAHLQTAALEVLAAVRSVLDAAEEVVRDPSAAVTLVATLAARARAGHDGGGGDDDGDDDGPGGIERIPVSG